MGYHLNYIPRGFYGELSKIEEELAEIKDAVLQENEIMELNELSDLYGALEAYLEKRFDKRFSMVTLGKMSNATKRAFEDGTRKNRDGN
jgi:hypothetical protein